MIPEGLKLFREIVINTMHPFGLDLTNCGNWCDEEPLETVVYSGCLYSTMDIVLQKGILNMLTSYPKDKLVKLGKLFMKITPIYKLAMRTKSMISQVPKRALRVLRHLGFDVGCLKAEPYSGALLYDYGFVDDFSEYANRVYDYLREQGVKKLITLDPHTYNIMKFVYPQFVHDYDLEVENIVDILLKHIDGHTKKLNLKVTIHDPCQYARSPHRKIIDEPRKILATAGVSIVEPFATKNMTWCCGGPIESLFSVVSERIAELRVNQLLETGANKIIVMCPVCYANLGKALRRMHANAEIMDLIDVVYKAVVEGG